MGTERPRAPLLFRGHALREAGALQAASSQKPVLRYEGGTQKPHSSPSGSAAGKDGNNPAPTARACAAPAVEGEGERAGVVAPAQAVPG